MSVKIRLKRMGSKKRPFYRIVASDSRSPRDGRFIETLGYYNPMTEPPKVEIKEDLIFKWMERGAKPSPNTESILRNAGVIKKWSLLKQGVKPDELDAKYEELKSKETPPMSPTEREIATKAKKAAKAETTAEETEAEAPAEAAEKAPAEAEAPAEAAEKKPAEPEAPAKAAEKAPAEAEAASEETPEEPPAEGDEPKKES